jgi:hypothetical protein
MCTIKFNAHTIKNKHFNIKFYDLIKKLINLLLNIDNLNNRI